MRSARITMSLLVLGATLMVGASPASAGGCLHIHRIHFDSRGPDDFSNNSLNGEWIQLHNSCGERKPLRDWKVKDDDGNVYRRFRDFKLGAGDLVRIHTGRGQNDANDRYWRRDNYVWNNGGDVGLLKNPRGRLVSRCQYSSATVSANQVLC